MHDAGRDLCIALGTGGHPDETGAQCPGLLQPHGGMDAQRPGLVRAGDDAGAGFAVGDADGFAAVFGVVQLFDGREESVHVHEGDEARPVVVGVRHGTIDPSRVDKYRSRSAHCIQVTIGWNKRLNKDFLVALLLSEDFYHITIVLLFC